MLKNQEVIVIANKYNISVSQLCIRYDIQLGTVALPKTANPVHMQENTAVDFEISDADMDILKNICPDQGVWSPESYACFQWEITIRLSEFS